MNASKRPRWNTSGNSSGQWNGCLGADAGLPRSSIDLHPRPLTLRQLTLLSKDRSEILHGDVVVSRI